VKLALLPPKKITDFLRNKGLRFRVGQFNVCLSTSVEEVADHLINLYGSFGVVSDDDFIDFYTEIEPPSTLRRYFRPQVNFSFDGAFPFKPLPYQQASAMFEWGLNWCIASHTNQYLIIHGAVVEMNGQAIIFPGTPGSGKSTLCAALVCTGWRLLSDEMTLLSSNDGLIYPIPRPINLKNQSIDVIRTRYPDRHMGTVVRDTLKGTVAHLCPPEDSVRLSAHPAKPAKLVFPKYIPGSETKLEPLAKSRAFIKAIDNSFNYNILGAAGFNCLGDLIEAADCFEFSYSSLDEAITLFTELVH
jgi:HprK-related kinase A